MKSTCPNCGIADVLYTARNERRDAINTAFLNLIEGNPGLDAIVTGHSLGGAHAAAAATELRALNGTSTPLVRASFTAPNSLSIIDIRIVYLRSASLRPQLNHQPEQLSHERWPRRRWHLLCHPRQRSLTRPSSVRRQGKHRDPTLQASSTVPSKC